MNNDNYTNNKNNKTDDNWSYYLNERLVLSNKIPGIGMNQTSTDIIPESELKIRATQNTTFNPSKKRNNHDLNVLNNNRTPERGRGTARTSETRTCTNNSRKSVPLSNPTKKQKGDCYQSLESFHQDDIVVLPKKNREVISIDGAGDDDQLWKNSEFAGEALSALDYVCQKAHEKSLIKNGVNREDIARYHLSDFEKREREEYNEINGINEENNPMHTKYNKNVSKSATTEKKKTFINQKNVRFTQEQSSSSKSSSASRNVMKTNIVSPGSILKSSTSSLYSKEKSSSSVSNEEVKFMKTVSPSTKSCNEENVRSDPMLLRCCSEAFSEDCHGCMFGPYCRASAYLRFRENLFQHLKRLYQWHLHQHIIVQWTLLCSKRIKRNQVCYVMHFITFHHV